MDHHRRFLIITVYALPVLAVLATVTASAAWLVEALQDAVGGAVLRGFALGMILLLIADTIVVVGLLGIKSLASDDNDESEPPA